MIGNQLERMALRDAWCPTGRMAIWGAWCPTGRMALRGTWCPTGRMDFYMKPCDFGRELLMKPSVLGENSMNLNDLEKNSGWS